MKIGFGLSMRVRDRQLHYCCSVPLEVIRYMPVTHGESVSIIIPAMAAMAARRRSGFDIGQIGQFLRPAEPAANDTRMLS
jgi:hypothetical protein